MRASPVAHRSPWSSLNPRFRNDFVMLGGYAGTMSDSMSGLRRQWQAGFWQAVVKTAGLMAVTVGIVINSALFFTASQASGLARVLHNLARTSLVMLCLLALPVSLASSILRYRLWDIDLILRRTLVYASLTAALVMVYLSCVVMLQVVVGGLAGGEQPALVTVLSTLAIAALFVPLRRRLQEGIDRRFFRRKYDAARTLRSFASAARDETDLDRLSAQLVAVVQETMQPAGVELWLRRRQP